MTMNLDLDLVHKLSLVQRNLQTAQTAIDSAEEFLKQVLDALGTDISELPTTVVRGKSAVMVEESRLLPAPFNQGYEGGGRGGPVHRSKKRGRPAKQEQEKVSSRGRKKHQPQGAPWKELAEEYIQAHQGAEFTSTDIVEWAKQTKGMTVIPHKIGSTLTYMKGKGWLARRPGKSGPNHPAVYHETGKKKAS